MSDEAIRLEGVRKTYRGFTLDLPELSLGRGYVLGLIGRNGAGKSTLINLLMNLVYPDRGRVEVLGLVQPADSVAIKRRVGLVSENPSFYLDMTVGWTAAFVSRFFPTWDDGLYRAYLNRFALDPGKKVRQLSKGMVIKLGLMLALSHRPELLILDEPTSGVDPVMRRALLKEIAGLIRDERRSVVFSSHITQDLEQVADYVVVLEGGRIREHDTVEGLGRRWKQVTGTLPDGGIRADFVTFRSEGNTFVGVTRDFSPDLLRELGDLGARDLRVLGAGLDDILVSLSEEEAR